LFLLNPLSNVIISFPSFLVLFIWLLFCSFTGFSLCLVSPTWLVIRDYLAFTLLIDTTHQIHNEVPNGMMMSKLLLLSTKVHFVFILSVSKSISNSSLSLINTFRRISPCCCRFFSSVIQSWRYVLWTGGLWEPLDPPQYDSNGNLTNCKLVHFFRLFFLFLFQSLVHIWLISGGWLFTAFTRLVNFNVLVVLQCSQCCRFDVL
jgi:hypothetical protein